MEGVHVVGDRATWCGRRTSPSGVQGQSPGRGSGRRKSPRSWSKMWN